MHDEVKASRERIARRRLLGGGSVIGLSALLAACAPANNPSPGSPTTGSTDAPPTGSPSPSPTPSPTPTPTPTHAELISKLDEMGACQLTSQETQGPYWFDVDSIRSDIREDRPGTDLRLALRVYDADCNPLPSSVVEIWHCDAGGIYSGYEVASRGGAGSTGTETSDGEYSEGETESIPVDDGTYLRGAQVADENGIVQFRTIWPGWYTGRTVHIHLKVHVDKTSVLTSQLYFDDDLNDEVFATDPYADHPGRDRRNDTDGIYDATGLLRTETLDDGYLAYANLGVN